MRTSSGRPGPGSDKLFSFGLISDVQHADIEDGASFAGIPRFYRAALPSLARAVAGWRAAGADFCVHLGDIVDGFAKENAAAALDAVIAEFDRLGRRHLHMLGNHCLYNTSRETLNARLGMRGPPGSEECSYYCHQPHPGWRLLVLDGFDVSVLGWPLGHPRHAQARAILAARNPNEDKNNPERPAHLPRTERRFVQFGGGLGAAQLAWLRGQLAAARAGGQRCLLLCHLPLHPDTCAPACLLWDYEEVLALTAEFADVCVATFAGHAHRDGWTTDAHGVYHRVLAGVVETPPGEDCSALVSVHADRVELLGAGGVRSETLPLAPRKQPQAAAPAR